MSERVLIGRVGKPHGLDGAFFVEGPSEDPRWFERGSRFLAGGVEAEVVVARRGAGGRPVIRLDRAVPRGTLLEVARSELPPTEEGEYYAFELLGLEVIEEGGRSLGHVEAVVPGVANDALDLGNGMLLPLVEACIRTIDLEAARILVAPGFSDSD
ncbi:MAG TPA: ribosome maturation factor RimM [Gaiellaceae bacterium]|jgi:16S rRNA processing protein RimM|nr:ribosome maturation factor RimM [Gaiellaceae bacterium]